MVDGLHASFPSLTTLSSVDIAGEGAGTTVAQELLALADKDADQDTRISACESDIAELRESIKQNEERLALWGRGVVAGFIPKEPETKVVAERLAVTIDFTPQEDASIDGTLIDGTGALWMNAGASGVTFSADGVFTFHKAATLTSTLKTKYGISGVTMSRDMGSLVTFTDNPLLLLEILQAYTKLSASNVTKVLAKADDFDPKDFVKMDTSGAIETPIYVYPEDGKLKTLCAYFNDENASDDLIFDISKRTEMLLGKLDRKSIPRTATDKYTRAGIRETFTVMGNFLRTARSFRKAAVLGLKSAYEKEWADYSCFSKTTEPNDGQVCVGSLMVAGKEAAVITTGREQIYTSPFMQVSPLFKTDSSSSDNSGGTGSGTIVEGSRFDVQITKIGSSKIALIKAYREITGASLADAKKAVESEDGATLKDVGAADVQIFKKKLEDAGATVKLINL